MHCKIGHRLVPGFHDRSLNPALFQKIVSKDDFKMQQIREGDTLSNALNTDTIPRRETCPAIAGGRAVAELTFNARGSVTMVPFRWYRSGAPLLTTSLERVTVGAVSGGRHSAQGYTEKMEQTS